MSRADWAEINAEIKLGRVPWVNRVEDSTVCIWHIYGDPDNPKATIDEILIGRRCPTRTRWRFVSGEGSEIQGGPYCYSHIRKIIDTPAEVGRYRRMVAFLKADEERRNAWRGTP